MIGYNENRQKRGPTRLAQSALTSHKLAIVLREVEALNTALILLKFGTAQHVDGVAIHVIVHPFAEHASVDVLGQRGRTDLPEAVGLAIDRQRLLHQRWQEVGLDRGHVGFRQDEGLVPLLQQPEQRVEGEGRPLQMRHFRVDLCCQAKEDGLVSLETARSFGAQPGVVQPDPSLDARAERILCKEDEVCALPWGIGPARGEAGPVLREERLHLDELEFDEGHYKGHLHPLLTAGLGDSARKYRRGDVIAPVEEDTGVLWFALRTCGSSSGHGLAQDIVLSAVLFLVLHHDPKGCARQADGGLWMAHPPVDQRVAAGVAARPVQLPLDDAPPLPPPQQGRVFAAAAATADSFISSVYAWALIVES